MVNKVILVGRLGADPELRTANSGTSIANLRLATDSRVKRGDSWENETEWHRVTVFGRTADNVARFCGKGKQLYIEGRLQTRKWQDKDGRDRYTTEIVANVVQFLGGKGDNGGHSGGYQGGYQGGESAGPDDGIPF